MAINHRFTTKVRIISLLHKNGLQKMCFVIQRYGLDINGGAETYCRVYAEKMSSRYDVTVLTTCALDYQEWRNHYPVGEEVINGVKCIRFPVDRKRHEGYFARLSGKIYNDPAHSLDQSLKWIVEQGPVSKQLINYIEKNRNSYDLFFFMTYLYYPTVMGLRLVKDKAILVPFAHDEPPIYLKVYQGVFSSPLGIIYNTQEEQEFVQNRFNNGRIPSILTGIGLDIPNIDSFPDIKEKYSINYPYILYMGRIDVSKGCDILFDFFIAYKNANPSELRLLLIGKSIMNIPEREDIVYLGFVSENEKYAILEGSEILVLPSQYESLSIVVLEAMFFQKPVLVNGTCKVLKGHCTKSNGGLYFYGPMDFIECLKLLYQNTDLRSVLGRNGKKYIGENYQWDIIMDKMDRFISDMSQRR